MKMDKRKSNCYNCVHLKINKDAKHWRENYICDNEQSENYGEYISYWLDWCRTFERLDWRLAYVRFLKIYG